MADRGGSASPSVKLSYVFMKLGIDFGTTRIVVAAADRGNYPIVGFEAPDGEMREWFPPLIAARGPQRLYGWSAWRAQEYPGWTIVRSLKRCLDQGGPQTEVHIANQTVLLGQLLSELMQALKSALVDRSTANLRTDEQVEVMLGVPANANTNQRFLTSEAFRCAGFSIAGMLNEPSAASIEFSHKRGSTNSRILVYDLGGGTFDASLVECDGGSHTVVASEGITTLGGDDFDTILAELALESAGVEQEERDGMTQAEWFRLQDECRDRKEALHPNTRRIIVDLERVRQEWAPVTILAADFYAACRPLVEETVHATEDLLARHAAGKEIDALYVTGGGSELPLVSRTLRERFGRRVRRSAHTRSATAIGLAIQAAGTEGYALKDRFTRYFGVWRESEDGRSIVFDPLFAKGTGLPAPGEPPLERTRVYTPVHNVGHFRYIEASHCDESGNPRGDITEWDEIVFPFDRALQELPDLSRVDVERRTADGGAIRELYRCDSAGSVWVEISDLATGHRRTFGLGRWLRSDAPVKPGRKKKSAKG